MTHRESLRFFQILQNQYTNLPRDYFQLLQKAHKRNRDFVKLLKKITSKTRLTGSSWDLFKVHTSKTKHKKTPRFLQITSKTKHTEFPSFFQITSENRPTGVLRVFFKLNGLIYSPFSGLDRAEFKKGFDVSSTYVRGIFRE